MKGHEVCSRISPPDLEKNVQKRSRRRIQTRDPNLDPLVQRISYFQLRHELAKGRVEEQGSASAGKQRRNEKCWAKCGSLGEVLPVQVPRRKEGSGRRTASFSNYPLPEDALLFAARRSLDLIAAVGKSKPSEAPEARSFAGCQRKESSVSSVRTFIDEKFPAGQERASESRLERGNEGFALCCLEFKLGDIFRFYVTEGRPQC
ncbi:hypothetical protein KM043_018216 [Ampulex compressa]|nr:hypothetical protein KM043_018216 [Ampulex compressa]